ATPRVVPDLCQHGVARRRLHPVGPGPRTGHRPPDRGIDARHDRAGPDRRGDTAMTDRLVTLAGDRGRWERQGGESVRQHARFMVYRDLGRGRTLGRVQAACAADGDQVAAGTLRNTSSAHRWAERAEMWDRHRDDLHARVWLDARREAAERDAQLLSMAVEHLARRIQTLDLDEASISEVTHLLNTVLRHRRIL